MTPPPPAAGTSSDFPSLLGGRASTQRAAGGLTAPARTVSFAGQLSNQLAPAPQQQPGAAPACSRHSAQDGLPHHHAHPLSLGGTSLLHGPAHARPSMDVKSTLSATSLPRSVGWASAGLGGGGPGSLPAGLAPADSATGAGSPRTTGAGAGAAAGGGAASAASRAARRSAGLRRSRSLRHLRVGSLLSSFTGQHSLGGSLAAAASEAESGSALGDDSTWGERPSAGQDAALASGGESVDRKGALSSVRALASSLVVVHMGTFELKPGVVYEDVMQVRHLGVVREGARMHVPLPRWFRWGEGVGGGGTDAGKAADGGQPCVLLCAPGRLVVVRR